MKNIPIGQLLLEKEYITPEQLNSALSYQRENPGTRLGDVFVQLGYIKEEDQLRALSERLNVPMFTGYEINVTSEVSSLISESIARKYQVMPLEVRNNALFIAMRDPLDLYALEEIKANVGIPVSPVLAPSQMISNAINRTYSAANVSDAINQMNQEFSQSDNLDDVVEATQRAPLVKFVNNLIRQAFEQGASDVHIEPFDKHVAIRMRVDGVLREFTNISKNTQNPLVTRLKIIGGMNIAERRVPQDGRIGIVMDNVELDIRVSTIPTIYGEKVVIRLLGNSLQTLSTLKDLGLDDYNHKTLSRFIQSPNGIILLTGPTGSGKSTTLYTILQELSTPQVNIITVEDPVEKKINGINQVQVNPKAGLTFASGLRSILRQDPDIIMIGEIRDEETAQIAVRSAITGHLVLSTVHTNDTATAVARLRDMGIEPYLVSASLVGVIAQRLVRRLCPHCKKEVMSSKSDASMLHGYRGSVFKAIGCPQCNNLGYKGRIAIFEMLTIDNVIKEMIIKNESSLQIQKQGIAQGMKTLSQSMQELVREGVTSVEEMVRVTFDGFGNEL